MIENDEVMSVYTHSGPEAAGRRCDDKCLAMLDLQLELFEQTETSAIVCNPLQGQW
jgi:hypothetical protein